jgi:hypothetical protein
MKYKCTHITQNLKDYKQRATRAGQNTYCTLGIGIDNFAYTPATDDSQPPGKALRKQQKQTLLGLPHIEPEIYAQTNETIAQIHRYR